MVMVVLFTILAGISLFLIEGRPLIKSGQRKELAVVSIILGISIFLVVADHFGITSPLKYLEQWLSPIGRALLNH